MNSSLTVVLPVHNAERTLRGDVTDVLEAAAELTSQVEVIIVDDASTDDSLESASELAREYRQVRVVRRSKRQNLQATLSEIRASISSEVVIVHDGSSRVNPDQLRLIWRQQQVLGAVRDAADSGAGVSFADLRRPAIAQQAMEVAHRRLWGFQRVAASAAGAQPEAAGAELESDNLRADEASQPAPVKRGMGIIPKLPRAGVFGSISDFARGE